MGFVIVACTEKGGFLLFFNTFQSSGLNYIFYGFTRLVEIPVFLILSLIFIWNNTKMSVQIGLAGIFSLVISLILKDIFLQARPIHFLRSQAVQSFNEVAILAPHEGFTSYPSGHSMAAFALMLTLAIKFNNKWTSLLMVILAIGGGLSRIYLLNHYLEDVLAGSLIGIYLALLLNKVMSFIKIPTLKDLLIRN